MARESHANRPPQRDDDTGVELVSCLGTGAIVGPRATVDIGLGVKCKVHEEESDEPLPWMLISRSSTAKNTPFRLANAVGIIDAGHRGEVRALLDNADDQCRAVADCQRLVQSVSYTGRPIMWNIVDKLEATARGCRG